MSVVETTKCQSPINDDREKIEIQDQEDQDALCLPSPEESRTYDFEDESSCSSISSSSSSSESSIVSATDSSDLSSPITCVPWMERNSILVDERANSESMGGACSSGSSICLDRKRKERHESSCSQEQDNKVIRATEPEENKIPKSSLEDKTFEDAGMDVEKSEIPSYINTVPSVPGFGDDKDYGKSIPPISVSADDYEMRTMPINFEPEIQRQWERTAAQWHSRKLRRTHRPRHYGKSSKSFSEAEEVIRNNHCNLEELSISNSSSSPMSEDTKCDGGDKENDQRPNSAGDGDEDFINADVSGATFDPLPLLDLSTLHHQVESDVPISYSRHSSEQVMLSPRNSITIITEGIDVIPPSPPIYQTPVDPPLSRQILDGNQESKINNLSRQLVNWKKQLKTLEEEYIRLMGYKPSHADKANNREMRKCIIHITKAKHELKQIREDPSSALPRFATEPFPLLSPNSRRRLEGTVSEIEAILMENREVQCRPEDIILMSPAELQSEKGIMQKQLLMLEKRHGRPTTKEEKGIVRELYDRYRIVKKMSSRVTTVKENSLDLAPILEHETLKLPTTESGDIIMTNSLTEIKRSPRSHRKRFGRSSSSPVEYGSNENPNFQNEDFNDMDLIDLQRHYKMTSEEKRRLRSALRTIESESQGPSRLQQRDEKYTTVESELIYQKYKHARATLRLLDVLINKRKYPYLLKDTGKIED